MRPLRVEGLIQWDWYPCLRGDQDTQVTLRWRDDHGKGQQEGGYM